MIKSAQLQVALASIVALFIGTQYFDAVIAQTRVENPNLNVDLSAQESNSTQASILRITTLTLDTVANVPWGSSINVTGKLTDNAASGAGVGGKTITFRGTGAANLASETTNIDGTFTAKGKAPSTLATGWTVQAHFVDDSVYNSADSNSQSYNTLKHTTSITLDTITYVPSGMTAVVTGKLTDSTASYAAIESQTITFTGTGAANLPSVVTSPDGTFAASAIAPNSIATGWTIQAHYNGNVTYISSDSNTQSYNTLK